MSSSHNTSHARIIGLCLPVCEVVCPKGDLCAFNRTRWVLRRCTANMYGAVRWSEQASSLRIGLRQLWQMWMPGRRSGLIYGCFGGTWGRYRFDGSMVYLWRRERSTGL